MGGSWDEVGCEVCCCVAMYHSLEGRSCGKEAIGTGGGGGNDELGIFAVALFDCLEACC